LKNILGLTLGIMTALGGFIDLGQIIFTMQAGALFGYSLLWVMIPGTIAIILYMEMCGRIAAVAHRPVFEVIRKRMGKRLGVATLAASNLLNLITCAAELCGVGIVLKLLTGWNARLSMCAAVALLVVLIWLMKFQWIERTFGILGLLMVVFAVSVFVIKPDWHAVGSGFLPRVPTHGSHDTLLYAYFAVGIFSALLMEYEVHFYSSGAIEEDWKIENLNENILVATLGTILGALLTCALLILAALVFLPRHIFPEILSTTVMPAAVKLGPTTVRIALLGMLACIAGAAVETALSGAYNICQFYDLAWGKNKKPTSVAIFTGIWIGMFITATGLALSGIEPTTLVNVGIIFGMVIMPITYYPILRSAGDRKLLGKHANNKFLNFAAWSMLAIITVAALAALPLMIITNSGQP
jgi:manganese transport protein